MVTIDVLRKVALSFPEATEDPHFEKTSFRVKKKIFATFDQKHNRACLKLSVIDQNVFSSFDKSVIYPVPNKFALQGWTFVEMDKVNEKMFEDALTTAFCAVAPKHLAKQVRPD